MNIYNQNVAFNYRGILNLDATTINTPLDATLRAVTDGTGAPSLLNLSTEQVGVLRTINLPAGATIQRLFNVAYTINNSGAQTGNATGIFLNATETALNGMTHNLLDLQVGGVSKYKFDNLGTATFSGGLSLGTNLFIGGFQTRLTANGSGIIALYDNAGTSFNRLQLGGTTNLFPSIKRNGAAIDFRLADDSAFCSVNGQTFSGFGFSASGYIATEVYYGGGSSNFRFAKRSDDTTWGTWNNGAFCVSASAVNVSAILQADSTTKGFLPPRMTTTQINAIATPAEGLQVYNTTINHMCFFMNGTWQRINHSPM